MKNLSLDFSSVVVAISLTSCSYGGAGESSLYLQLADTTAQLCVFLLQSANELLHRCETRAELISIFLIETIRFCVDAHGARPICIVGVTLALAGCRRLLVHSPALRPAPPLLCASARVS